MTNADSLWVGFLLLFIVVFWSGYDMLSVDE